MSHNKRGQGLVEFALILPVLLLVLFAIVDTAFAVQGYLTVNHAAREAARFAVVYIPLQGECLNRDFNGGPIYEPWPYCPLDYQEQTNEPDENYFNRRVELIKLRAIDATLGLRVDRICKTLQCITDNYGETGMLSVRVWGFQAFDAPEQEERPGLPGLPVRVEVTHNVPLVIFGAFLPNAMVRVSSGTDMINEGIQVGFGNLAPPTFSPGQPAVPPGTALPTNTPGPSPTIGPTPTPTPIPVYNISLSPKNALNVLPTERQHLLTAHITDELGANVAGARVTFRTTQGSFHPSGVGTKTATATTGADGRARITLFANAPLSANLTAWLDHNGDWLIDTNEPSDTAAKTYTANGPYLIVSNHAPAPLEWLAVSLMDHNSLQNPYSLWWCPDSITATQVTAQLGFPLNINVATSHLEDVPVQVPLGVAGRYRIESHTGSGGANGCSEPGTLVAYSASIEIATIPPDLVVESVTIVDEEYIRPGEPITVVITVRNQSPVAVESGPFDVDVYMPLVNPPQIRQMGVSKHWVGNLSALGSFQITTTAILYDLAPQNLWVQVDTTDYVDEGDIGGENNNVYGPVVVQARTCVPIRGRSDDFDGGLGGQWTGIDFPIASHSVGGGQLQIMPNRGLIGGTADGGHYVYQSPISGDFRVVARVISIGSTNTGAEAGLMARESLDLNSRYFATLVKRNNQVHQDRRETNGGAGAEAGNTGISLPLWVRIDRIGNVFRSYSSTNGTTWTERSSARTIALGPVYVGLVANSNDNALPGAALFDDFSVCVPSGASCTPIAGRDDNFDSGLGGQWLSETLLRGSESAAGTLSVIPGWGDIGNPANYDSFRYLYQSPVTGNFSMTVRVLSLQSSNNAADAGLMLREALEPDARSYSFTQRRESNLDRRFRTTPGTNDSSATNGASAPQYLRIARQGNVFRAWSSADGTTWTLRRTDTLAAMPDALYIGLATSALNGTVGAAIYDDFEICTPYDASNLPTPPGPPEVYPPGLVQCTELLRSPSFEGNPVNVFNVWKPGDANGLTGAYARTSAEFYQGSFSLRLHASNSVIPCSSNQLQPYVYQDVTFPASVFSQSTLIVAGYYRVAGSNLTCSMPNSPDADDKLRVSLRQTNGTPIVAPQDIINGGMAMGQWYPLSVGLHTFIPNISIYKNQTLRLQWDAFNDGDINGTFFYMDQMSAQLCTEWAIPPDVPDTASVGGKITTRGENNIPTPLPGADVWAYTQGGEPYHTRSIHDGTYHFYNIPPGTYIIYAEAWVGGQLRTVMTQVTLGNNERNYAVNLLLQ